MSRLPYTAEVKLDSFSPDIFNALVNRPYCFYMDSACMRGKEGRYSFFGADPVRAFSNTEGMITVDGHTFIDNPIHALKNFESYLSELPSDPYLPFSGGLVGFVSHSWPTDPADHPLDLFSLPDAWFGLYDTIITFDHLENSCWISSMGLTDMGRCSTDLAKLRCDTLLGLIETKSPKNTGKYIIKPLTPEPASNFSKDNYIRAVEAAKDALNHKRWQRTNLARRFHAPVAVNAWTIHKLLREKNPTPYSSFMRCGTFEITSTAPSYFLKLDEDHLTCNVIQKGIARADDETEDCLNKTELLHTSLRNDPVVNGDETSLEKVFAKRSEIEPSHIESDSRSHYLVNRIEGEKTKGRSVTDCLMAAMPGASMTGVPKIPVNKWLRKTEPARRQIYTGAMGIIDSNSKAQFNTAVRTMTIKDQVAFVHAGWQIDRATDAEEAFCRSENSVAQLFESIKRLGS